MGVSTTFMGYFLLSLAFANLTAGTLEQADRVHVHRHAAAEVGTGG